jgi:protein-disulfide isomerase
VSASQWSAVGGVSLGFIGWLFYSFVLTLLLVFPPGHKARGRIRRFLAWLVAAALLADVGLLGVQLFALKNICLLCLATYVANIGLLKSFGWEVLRDSGGSLLEATKQLFLQKRSAKMGGNSIAVALVIFGSLAVGGWILQASGSGAAPVTPVAQEQPVDNQSIRDLWQLAPRKVIPIRASDASKGNPSAPVKVIVFSDFECPYCKRAAFVLGNALESMLDRVQLVFKHFPLDSLCNPQLDRPMHPNACTLAHLSYCANKKNQFWKFHDQVFFQLSEADIQGNLDTLVGKLAGVFTKAEVDACLAATDAKASTREDVQLGAKLELRGTPAIFINGKQFSMNLTPENVRQAVEWELE